LIKTPPYWPQANGEVENMNRSILKRLQICNNNGTDYKQELKTFILMYNVTPHGTTGKSPSELLFGRRIKDKIPSLEEIKENLDDSETRDYDLLKKQKGKSREDKNRNAKNDDINIGDKVLVKNVIFPNKLTPNFNSKEYEIVDRKGNELVASGHGKLIKRNVGHFKKIPSSYESSVLQRSNMESPTVTSTLNSHEEVNEPNSVSEANEPNVGSNDEAKITPLKLKRIEGMWRPLAE
jgi:hypothetical protein